MLVGVREQRELPAGDHVPGGLVAADEDEQGLLDDRLVVEPLAVDLGVAEQADEVGLLRLGPPVGDHAELQLPEPHARLHRRQRDLGFRIRRRGADEVVGPLQQVVVGARLEPEHVGDEEQRQRGGDVPHEVALAALAHLVDDLVADRSDARLVIGHPLRA